MGKSRRSIAALMNLRLDFARVVEQAHERADQGASETERLKAVSPESVRIGAIVEVRPGERIPLDGEVITGSSWVDTSALTGESVPRSTAPGETVLAGFVNDAATIRIRITKVFAESSVSRILQLVEDAAARKAATEKLISRFAAVYTPIVVAVADMRELGVKRVVMLTGDNRNVAARVARNLAVDAWYAELLPEEKVAKVEELTAQLPRGERLAFEGDGINDAPVLMRADIGFAMGALGSDAAIEAADVVLMDDRVDGIASAIRLARHTRSVVVQNIVFALLVKLVFLGLGTLGIAEMWEAVIADMGVSVAAVLNANPDLALFPAHGEQRGEILAGSSHRLSVAIVALYSPQTR